MPSRVLPGRNPYKYPREENDEDFVGRNRSQKKEGQFKDQTGAVLQEDPWKRLNETCTLQKARREVYHYDANAPNDELDFLLKATYLHNEDTFKDKAEVVLQPETQGVDLGRILKNRIPLFEKPPHYMNHPLNNTNTKKKEDLNNVKLAIDGHHTQITNRGYCRKPDGGFFST